MSRFLLRKLTAAIALLAILGTGAKAAESAAGAYVLGIRGPGAGMTPPTGLFFSNQMFIYSGRIAGNVPFDGGRLAGDGKLKALVAVPTFLLVTPVEVFGGRLGLSLTTPYGNVDISGRLGPVRLADKLTTFADPSVGAFLGWREGNFHWQIGVTGFLPIGGYQKGELANVAKNRAALDVYGALTWLEPTWGLDISNTVGVTFNQRNRATDYTTGTEFHWEWSVSKRFDNGFSIGPAGYFYKQIGADSGSGAVLGSFKGQVWAIGGGIGYEFKVGPVPVTARVRYFREIDSVRRFKGDAVFLGVSFPLWVPGQKG